MTLTPHTSMGQYLMTYEGLVLYVKEMDEDRYQRLCSVSLHWPLTATWFVSVWLNCGAELYGFRQPAARVGDEGSLDELYRYAQLDDRWRGE
jgi:hypothetical protein